MNLRTVLFTTSLVLASLASACRDPEIVTYAVAKPRQSAGPTVAAPLPANTAPTVEPAAGEKTLTWSAAANWKPKQLGATRKGSYSVPGADGAEADLAITTFPGNVGGETANILRWRGQVGLPLVAEAELAKDITRFESNGLQFTVVDLTGTGEGAQRLLGAIIPVANATWFVKMTGPDRLIAAEKAAYLDFLRTIKSP